MFLIIENVIVTSISIFLVIPLVFGFLVLFKNNMLIASFLSAIFFSFLCHSGFEDIFPEKKTRRIFEPIKPFIDPSETNTSELHQP